MAADILVYKAGLVPVGIDQEPHLEVAREIARRFNQDYGTDFPEPQRFATKGEYVPSLTGEGKMSKTIEGSSINLTDSLDEIKRKIAKIPTDGGQGQEITGGVKSLFEFVKLFKGGDRMNELVAQYRSEGVRYGDIKSEVSEAIFEELGPLQERRKELENNPGYVNKVIEEGAQKARLVARETITEVRVKMGLK
jgi:tryptophanyl-tRNA synthetase